MENLGAFPASRAANGLGWNITLGNEWEWKASQDAGAKHGRVQCGWAGTELQSAAPANTSQGYAFPANCRQALTWAKQYGLSLTIVAAYGPPFHTSAQLTLSAAASKGATSLAVTVTGGSLSGVTYPYAYVQSTNNTVLSPRHSYAGTLLTSVQSTDATHATLSLASALSTGLTAGTTLTLQQVLYPAPSTNLPNDASVVAYAKYAAYIASQCSAAGVACDVELWNEPPWGDECWDNRSDCYDTSPNYNEESYGPNWGFVAALQLTTPPAGARYTWAGTNKSGDSTVLTTHMKTYTGVAYAQPNAAVTFESAHPYGNNPEDAAWSEPCLVASVANHTNSMACNLIATSTSNAWEMVALTLAAQTTNASYGIAHSITETGLSSLYGADEQHKALFALRQYLAYLADDFSYLEFYRLYEPNAGTQTGFSYAEPGTGLTYSPLPAFTALAGLVADVNKIAGAPIGAYKADASDLVTVASYSGTYPLDIVQLVGSRAGDTQSSLFVALYQRSVTDQTCAPNTTCWALLASPPPTRTTLVIPSGLHVASAIDLLTRAAVPHDVEGTQVELEVSDDPIELLLTP